MQPNVQQTIDRLAATAAEMVVLIDQLRTGLAATAKTSPPLPRPSLSRVLIGTKWNQRAARGSVGVLFRYQARKTDLAYSDLHQELVAIGAEANIGMMQKYARPLDRINRALAEVSPQIPPLTVLVMNMHTRQPSAGLNPHLARWLRATGHDDLAAEVDAVGMEALAPRATVDLVKKAVFDFPDWKNVIAALGLTGDPATDMARAL